MSEDEAGVGEAIDTFFGCLADRRLEDTLAAFTPEGDASLYGSEVSEIVIGHAALRSFFGQVYAKAHGPRFKLRDRRVSVRRDVAWFTAAAEVAFGEQVLAPYRVTGILEKREGRWLWALFNGSEPRPDR
jgi:ketosteroid isomerase-like protein